MSRTVRFRKNKFVPWWNDYSWKKWERVKPEDIDINDEVRMYSSHYRILIYYERKVTDKEKLKKIWWKSHKDDTFNFKEPGPHWFRNLTTERPLRRASKNELKKFMNDPNYEPVIESKGKLEYWT